MLKNMTQILIMQHQTESHKDSGDVKTSSSSAYGRTKWGSGNSLMSRNDPGWKDGGGEGRRKSGNAVIFSLLCTSSCVLFSLPLFFLPERRSLWWDRWAKISSSWLLGDASQSVTLTGGHLSALTSATPMLANVTFGTHLHIWVAVPAELHWTI